MAMLDQGPPPPPGVGAPQQPSMDALAGQGGAPQQGQGPGAASGVQKAVMEKMMLVEKTLQDAATIMPALAPVVADLVSTFRSRVGAIVLQGSGDGSQGAQGGSSLGQLAGAPAPTTF